MTGTSADLDYKLQPVPSVIAALFGGKKMAKHQQQQQQQQQQQEETRKITAPRPTPAATQYVMQPVQKFQYEPAPLQRTPQQPINRQQQQYAVPQFATPPIPSYGSSPSATNASSKDRMQQRNEPGLTVQEGGSVDIFIPIPKALQKQHNPQQNNYGYDPMKTIVFSTSSGAVLIRFYFLTIDYKCING